MRKPSYLLPTLLFLLGVIATPNVFAQRIAEHPFFKGMDGKWVEKGMLVPAPGAAPLKGEAVSTAAPILDGVWFELRGEASYGPAKWKYQWLFSLKNIEGKPKVYGHYIDSMGQDMRFLGGYDEATKTITMQANLPDGGKSITKLIRNEAGKLTILNGNFAPDGQKKTAYEAVSVKQ